MFSNLYISVTVQEMLESLQSYLSKDSLININCSQHIFIGEVLKLGSRKNAHLPVSTDYRKLLSFIQAYINQDLIQHKKCTLLKLQHRVGSQEIQVLIGFFVYIMKTLFIFEKRKRPGMNIYVAYMEHSVWITILNC